MDNHQRLAEALFQWLEEVRQDPPASTSSVRELAERPAWSRVRDVIRTMASADARPDLYGRDGLELRDSALLNNVGLSRIAKAAASGATIPTAELAGDLVSQLASPVPKARTWLLVNIDLPRGTDFRLGEGRVWAVTARDIEDVEPLPSMRAFVPASEIDPEVMVGATFLERPSSHGYVTFSDSVYAWPDSRPERLHTEPLMTLQMWDPDASVHAEAYFLVEPRKRLGRLFGSMNIEPVVDNYGEEVGERYVPYGYTVTEAQKDAFERFAGEVHSMGISVLGRRSSKKRAEASPTSRAFASASHHLVRASQRTFPGNYVQDAEANELLLDYVIAIEALMAAGEKETGDSTRKTSQRAAALWGRDRERLHVLRTIKKAYAQRSKFAHGSSINHEEAAELLEETRLVVLATALRWLVITMQFKEEVPRHLDESLVSETERQTLHEHLRSFFSSYPPADRPPDLS